MKRPKHTKAFPAFGLPKAKFLVFGQGTFFSEAFTKQVRSFSIEHVSSLILLQREVLCRTPLGQQVSAAFSRGFSVPDQALLAVVRKWFWARKPDLGFLLEGFPMTLLQAKVFDEWLEDRGENLHSIFATEFAPADLVTYYCTQGLPPKTYFVA